MLWTQIIKGHRQRPARSCDGLYSTFSGQKTLPQSSICVVHCNHIWRVFALTDNFWEALPLTIVVLTVTSVAALSPLGEWIVRMIQGSMLHTCRC